MRSIRNNGLFATLLVLALVCPATFGAEKQSSSALNLARQLNQAFTEVADQVSPAVVVILVAQKSSRLDLDDEENPLWDLLPPEFRKQLEQQREKQRKDDKDKKDETPSRREPLYN